MRVYEYDSYFTLELTDYSTNIKIYLDDIVEITNLTFKTTSFFTTDKKLIQLLKETLKKKKHTCFELSHMTDSVEGWEIANNSIVIDFGSFSTDYYGFVVTEEPDILLVFSNKSGGFKSFRKTLLN